MVFKALNSQAPTYLINMLKSACTNTHHGLRSKTSNTLYVPKAHHKVLDIMAQKFEILSMITPMKQNPLVNLKVNIRHSKYLKKQKG